MGLDAGNMNRTRVWVMRPAGTAASGFTFPWSWGDWYLHKRLIQERDVQLLGAMGTATFKLLRSTLSDNDPNVKQPFTWDDTTLPLVAGMYIAITVGDLAPTVDDAGTNVNILWWGYIHEIDGSQFAGTLEIAGTVEARGVGHLLDGIPVRGWARNDVAGYPSSIAAPLSANLGSNVDGQVLGNAVLGSSDLGGTDAQVFLFQNDPALCTAAAAALFTRWRLFKHLQLMCLQRAKILTGVNWSAVCLDGSQAVNPPLGTPVTIAGYLNDTVVPEVFTLRNQMVKGMLDLLIPRTMGFGWDIILARVNGQVGWQIVIYTTSDAATYGLPSFATQAKAINLPDLPVVDWKPQRQGGDRPDEIIVAGTAPIVFGVTVSFVDGNLAVGWDDTPSTGQEAVYRAGAGGGAGYSGLTTEQQLDRNRSIRQGPGLVDVFTRFALKPVSGSSGVVGDLRRSGASAGTVLATLPMCPEVDWNTTDAVFSTSSPSRSPYLPTMRLARLLPWIEGFDGGGNDKRPASQKAWPQFAAPRLFYYNPAAAAGTRWIDLLAKGGDRPTPSIDVDDRGAAVRVVYDKPERLGFNLIDLVTDAIYDLGQESAVTEGINAFDWKKVVATIGVPSDQRVQVSARRPGVVNDSDVRSSLKVEFDDLQFQFMHGGSILSIDADGLPVRVVAGASGGGFKTRNDFPRAQRILNQLCAWNFRKRTGFIYVGMRPDAPPSWAFIGCPISKVTERAAAGSVTEVSETYNVVVEKVERIWGDQPRLTVQGDLPPAPSFGGSVSASPSVGGPVSLANNGTGAQAIAQVRQEVEAVKKDAQRVPLVAAYNPGGGTVDAPNIYVIQGDNIIPGSSELGIAKRTDTVLASELPAGVGGSPGDTVVVPAFPIPSGLPAGVGVGLRLTTGGEYAFIVIDSRSFINSDCFAGQAVGIGGKVNLDVVSGGVTFRYVCLVPNAGPN